MSPLCTRDLRRRELKGDREWSTHWNLFDEEKPSESKGSTSYVYYFHGGRSRLLSFYITWTVNLTRIIYPRVLVPSPFRDEYHCKTPSQGYWDDRELSGFRRGLPPDRPWGPSGVSRVVSTHRRGVGEGVLHTLGSFLYEGE